MYSQLVIDKRLTSVELSRDVLLHARAHLRETRFFWILYGIIKRFAMVLLESWGRFELNFH